MRAASAVQRAELRQFAQAIGQRQRHARRSDGCGARCRLNRRLRPSSSSPG
jgi:hypothetical protein